MNTFLEVATNPEFDSLKDTMQMYQDNINNNITWFYSSLAIILAVLIVGLVFLVRNSISQGIEKGIEKTHKKIEGLVADKRELICVSGSATVSVNHENLMQVFNLWGLSKQNFVSLSIINKHGQVCDYHSLELKEINNIKGFDVKITDYDPERDGSFLYYNIVWKNDIND
ncbi:hypothetical protein GL282_09755 [Veillonella dispar]|nr:hypothetical protein [Veillonella dispar]